MSYVVAQHPQTYDSTIRRFEPAFWDVDFNLSSIATVVTTGANSFVLEGILRTSTDLIGLFWRSQDKFGHPLFGYENSPDWTGCTLSFDINYTGSPVINDNANALVMTVHDLSGNPYYVYLENYVTSGSASSRIASITLPFGPSVQAGIAANETIPWHFIENMFIGFVPPGYNGPAGPSTAMADLAVRVEMTNISVTGSNSTIGINTTALPAHNLKIADGYADSYPLTPQRVVDQIVNLGYRGNVVLYVGFVQFLSLTYDGGENRFIIDTTKPTLNVPTQQWVSDFCAKLNAAGLGVVMSVSFELLKQYCPLDWAQYDYKGQQSESGWSPSSTFVSPSSSAGMNYLRDVGVAFVGLARAAGATVHYQVGEPWWWAGGYRGDGPCFYDSHVINEFEALPFKLANPTNELGTPDHSMTGVGSYTTGTISRYFAAKIECTLSPSDQGIIYESGAHVWGFILYAYNGTLWLQSGSGAQFGSVNSLSFELNWEIESSGSRVIEFILDKDIGAVLAIDGVVVDLVFDSLSGNLVGGDLGGTGTAYNVPATNRAGWTSNSSPGVNFSGTIGLCEFWVNNKNWSSPTLPTPRLQTIYDSYEGSKDQTAYLKWLEYKLGTQTLWLADQIKAAYPGTPCTVLFYTPTVSNPLAPMITLVDFPQKYWKFPAWDYIQVEDYEVLEFNNFTQLDADLNVPIKDLGYPLSQCEYFAGFNLLESTTFIWDSIDRAIWYASEEKNYSSVLVWARPQVSRDGWVYNQDDYSTYALKEPAPTYTTFPILDQIQFPVLRTPRFNSLISKHVSGKEIRSPWAVYPIWEFEFSYDGLKQNDDDVNGTFNQIYSFFQGRKGRNDKFLYTDPENNVVLAQQLGSGDGFKKIFTVYRSIGSYYHEPVYHVSSLAQVYVNGTPLDPADYELYYNESWPAILFDTPPADGSVITADFTYQFVCRFSDDVMTFEEFMYKLHEVGTCKIVTVKP